MRNKYTKEDKQTYKEKKIMYKEEKQMHKEKKIMYKGTNAQRRKRGR